MKGFLFGIQRGMQTRPADASTVKVGTWPEGHRVKKLQVDASGFDSRKGRYETSEVMKEVGRNGTGGRGMSKFGEPLKAEWMDETFDGCGDMMRINFEDGLSASYLPPSKAPRLAECWNACAGMDDPAAEIAKLKAENRRLEKQPSDERRWDEARHGKNRDEIAKLRAEVERLRTVLPDVIEIAEEYVEQRGGREMKLTKEEALTLYSISFPRIWDAFESAISAIQRENSSALAAKDVEIEMLKETSSFWAVVRSRDRWKARAEEAERLLQEAPGVATPTTKPHLGWNGKVRDHLASIKKEESDG